jgi:hypothetical protein
MTSAPPQPTHRPSVGQLFNPSTPEVMEQVSDLVEHLSVNPGQMFNDLGAHSPFGARFAFPASMEAPQVRTILEPLFASYNVNIVFNGHNHLYAHTPELANGITGVTTGGGGGQLDTQSSFWRVGTWPQIQTQISQFHFMHVNVVGSTMNVEAIATNGSILHSFSIVP